MADALAKYLAANNLSRAEFSRMTGVSLPLLSQWLNGKRHPSLRSALRVERATNGALPVESWGDLDGDVVNDDAGAED